jgi:uncharacterized membrane protein YbhN (UPF0104 family)
MPYIRKILPSAVFLGCVFFIYSYVRNNLSDFTKISDISTPYLFMIGCVCVAMLIVNGLFLRALTISFDIDLNFFEYFSLSVVTSFGNLFLPMKGGSAFRAVYLKSRHDFDYSYFLSSLAANYLIVFSITSVAALACLGAFYVGYGAASLPVASAFLGVAAVTSWAILFPPPSLEWIPARSIRERTHQVLSGWNVIRKSRKTVAELCRLSAMNLFLGSLITWLEFAAFHMKDAHGNEIGFLQAAIFSCIGALTFLISITPAALGIKESLLMFSSRFLGISQSQALTISLLDRSVNVVVLCLFFGFAWIYVSKKLKMRNAGKFMLQGSEEREI